MAQQVRARIGKSCTGEDLADRLAYEVGASRHIAWCHMAHEDGAVAGLGPFVLQVGCDGFLGDHRQWQHVLAAPLGMSQRDRASAPVDIIAEPTIFSVS